MALVIIPQRVDRVDHVTIQLSGIYTDEQTFKVPFTERFSGNVTKETIRARLAGIVAAEQAQDGIIEQLALDQPFDLTPDPPVVPDPITPSQDDIDKRAFGVLLATHRQACAALSWGVGDQAAVDAAKSEIAKAYTPVTAAQLPILGTNGLV